MKELWGKCAYYWFIGMLIFVGLFVPKTNAATYESFSSAEARYYLDDHGTETQTTWHNIPYTESPTLPVKAMQYRLKSSDGFSIESTYKFKVSYLPTPDTLNANDIWFSDGTNRLQEVTCLGWTRENNGYYANTCTIQPINDISSSNYLYVRVVFNQNYVTSIRSYVGQYEERKGTNAVITEQTNNIINNQNNNTNSIINNQNNNTNSLINNNNQNTQDIINNQNANNQAILDSQKVCQLIDRNNVENKCYYLSLNGSAVNISSCNVNNYSYGISSYIKLNDTSTLQVLTNYSSNDGTCFYDVNKVLISCINQSSFVVDDFLTVPSNASYFRFTIARSSNKPQFKLCSNGNNALNDTMSDDGVDDPTGMLDDMEDLVATNGTITQLISLPVTLYTKVLNSINGTCSQFNLGELYNTNLIIPCIDVSQYLGNTVWTTIDLIISGAFVIVIAKKMIKTFENFSSMKEGDVLGD